MIQTLFMTPTLGIWSLEERSAEELPKAFRDSVAALYRDTYCHQLICESPKETTERQTSPRVGHIMAHN